MASSRRGRKRGSSGATRGRATKKPKTTASVSDNALSGDDMERNQQLSLTSEETALGIMLVKPPGSLTDLNNIIAQTRDKLAHDAGFTLDAATNKYVDANGKEAQFDPKD